MRRHCSFVQGMIFLVPQTVICISFYICSLGGGGDCICVCIHVKYFNKKSTFLQSDLSPCLPTDILQGVLLCGKKSFRKADVSWALLFNMICFAGPTSLFGRALLILLRRVVTLNSLLLYIQWLKRWTLDMGWNSTPINPGLTENLVN